MTTTIERDTLEACGLWTNSCRRQAVEAWKSMKTALKDRDKEFALAARQAEWAHKHPLKVFMRRMGREFSRPFRAKASGASAKEASPKIKLTKAERLKKERTLRMEVPAAVHERWQDLNASLEPSEVEFLLDRTSEGQRWIFPFPTPRLLALAALLSAKSCEVTVGACPKWMRRLGDETLHFTDLNLSERLRYESEFLAGFHVVAFDSRHQKAVAEVLAQRLWPRQSLLEIGDASEEPGQLINAYAQREKSLTWYSAPPEDFRHPDWERDPRQTTEDWPRPPATPIRFPEVMPSGRPWPKITVVTVTRNQASYFPETLDSVLEQGYPNLEYIVLDGASLDETPQILQRYATHLAYSVSERDEGQADALNKGFARSTGEIMTWLNSDDRYLPDTLRRVALAFDAHPEASLVAGGCALVHGRDPLPKHIHHCRFPDNVVTPLPLSNILDLDQHWLKGDFFYQPEVFWRRSLWEQAGAAVRKDLYYSMDYELWVRFAAAGAKLLPIPESLVLFRLHEAQKTHGADEPFVPELRRINAGLREKYANR